MNVCVMAGESLLLNICKLLVMVFKRITGNIVGIQILQKVKLTCAYWMLLIIVFQLLDSRVCYPLFACVSRSPEFKVAMSVTIATSTQFVILKWPSNNAI